MADVPDAGKAPEQKASKKRPVRPNKPIPTERMKIERQLAVLRAFASVYASTGKPVTNREVAETVDMAETTTSLANYFFAETGLLQKASGGMVPVDEVLAYNQAFAWEPETAAHNMGPVLAGGWFWEVLQPKLTFRPLEENDAITALGAACAAAPAYKLNLKVILDFLVAGGLVERDGSILRIARQTKSPDQQVAKQAEPAAVETHGPAGGRTSTGFSQHRDAVHFNINVDVSMTELGSWSPERITALFAGIAQVMAAKSGLEKKVAGT
ncbi:MAG: hypothetical protein AB7H88_18485 [Vicinamibacterales bacterium]